MKEKPNKSLVDEVLVRLNSCDSFLDFGEIRDDTIEHIRSWRNLQIDVLRQKKHISSQEQLKYFTKIAWPEMKKAQPVQLIFTLEQRSELQGYGGLVNIDWDHMRAEVSFLLRPEIERIAKKKTALFSEFLERITGVAFDHLRLNRLFTETYTHRVSHIGVLEKCNFVAEGTLRQHVRGPEGFQDSVIHAKLRSDTDGNEIQRSLA